MLPKSPASEFLVGDFTGLGFDAAALSNTSSQSITVSYTVLGAGTPTQVRAQLRDLRRSATERELPARANRLAPRSRTFAAFFVVSASRPTLLVTLTSPTTPAGTTMLSALDGR